MAGDRYLQNIQDNFLSSFNITLDRSNPKASIDLGLQRVVELLNTQNPDANISFDPATGYTADLGRQLLAQVNEVRTSTDGQALLSLLDEDGDTAVEFPARELLRARGGVPQQFIDDPDKFGILIRNANLTVIALDNVYPNLQGPAPAAEPAQPETGTAGQPATSAAPVPPQAAPGTSPGVATAFSGAAANPTSAAPPTTDAGATGQPLDMEALARLRSDNAGGVPAQPTTGAEGEDNNTAADAGAEAGSGEGSAPLDMEAMANLRAEDIETEAGAEAGGTDAVAGNAADGAANDGAAADVPRNGSPPSGPELPVDHVARVKQLLEGIVPTINGRIQAAMAGGEAEGLMGLLGGALGPQEVKMPGDSIESINESLQGALPLICQQLGIEAENTWFYTPVLGQQIAQKFPELVASTFEQLKAMTFPVDISSLEIDFQNPQGKNGELTPQMLGELRRAPGMTAERFAQIENTFAEYRRMGSMLRPTNDGKIFLDTYILSLNEMQRSGQIMDARLVEDPASGLSSGPLGGFLRTIVGFISNIFPGFGDLLDKWMPGLGIKRILESGPGGEGGGSSSQDVAIASLRARGTLEEAGVTPDQARDIMKKWEEDLTGEVSRDDVARVLDEVPPQMHDQMVSSLERRVEQTRQDLNRTRPDFVTQADLEGLIAGTLSVDRRRELLNASGRGEGRQAYNAFGERIGEYINLRNTLGTIKSVRAERSAAGGNENAVPSQGSEASANADAGNESNAEADANAASDADADADAQAAHLTSTRATEGAPDARGEFGRSASGEAQGAPESEPANTAVPNPTGPGP